MDFTKIKYKDNKIELAYKVENLEGLEDEYTLKSTDEPRQDF